MNDLKIQVLKLGGGLITDKNKPLTVKHRTLRRIAKEISRYVREKDPKERLIIIHGGGSYGHYVAKKFLDLKGGYDEEAFTHISKVMIELNRVVIEKLINEGINAISVQTHAISCIVNGEAFIELGFIKYLIKKGFVPVLYGDIVISKDDGLKYEILSGDTIAWYLANKLSARRLLFATNVDGVYDRDPSKSGARLLKVVSLSDLKLEATKPPIDVTGGMMKKLLDGLKYIREGMEVIIFNGSVRNRIYNALIGKPIISTYVRP